MRRRERTPEVIRRGRACRGGDRRGDRRRRDRRLERLPGRRHRPRAGGEDRAAGLRGRCPRPFGFDGERKADRWGRWSGERPLGEVDVRAGCREPRGRDGGGAPAGRRRGHRGGCHQRRRPHERWRDRRSSATILGGAPGGHAVCAHWLGHRAALDRRDHGPLPDPSRVDPACVRNGPSRTRRPGPLGTDEMEGLGRVPRDLAAPPLTAMQPGGGRGWGRHAGRQQRRRGRRRRGRRRGGRRGGGRRRRGRRRRGRRRRGRRRRGRRRRGRRRRGRRRRGRRRRGRRRRGRRHTRRRFGRKQGRQRRHQRYRRRRRRR